MDYVMQMQFWQIICFYKNIGGFRGRKYKNKTKKVSHRSLEMDLEGGGEVFCSVQKQLKYGYTIINLLSFE